MTGINARKDQTPWNTERIETQKKLVKIWGFRHNDKHQHSTGRHLHLAA
jgi:hypothetical protein